MRKSTVTLVLIFENMKKIIPFLLCMLVALWACEKDTPTPPASVDSMQFEGVTTTLNEVKALICLNI